MAHRPAKKLRRMVDVCLSGREKKLFDFLLDVEKSYACNAVLRVAGGWVRDKLLGRSSDDVDIVLDTMTGRDFAELINRYEADHGQKKHPVGIIKANPDQSKHLETATMQLGEIGWVDFVNLRSETYSEEHRIPTVEFGSPLEDAQRRDFTINSLFYNIKEQKVEDFTQMGLRDLQDGIMRTPLDPKVTFLDDPLRILRAVRFAARFGFQLHEDICDAIATTEIKEALGKKVSRERIGKEVLGMIVGTSAAPEQALKLLHDLDLCSVIFLQEFDQQVVSKDAKPIDFDSTDRTRWDVAYNYCDAMCSHLRNRKGDFEVSELNETEQNAFKLRILSCILMPLRDLYVTIKSRQVPLVCVILRDFLKLKNRDVEDVGNVILTRVDRFQRLVQQDFDRVEVGMSLREIGQLWRVLLDVAYVHEVVESHGKNAHDVLTKYDAFVAAVNAHGLDGVWSVKPLLNGKDAIQDLGVPPGPQVKQVLEKVLRWQLAHPHATRHDCLEHFKVDAR